MKALPVGMATGEILPIYQKDAQALLLLVFEFQITPQTLLFQSGRGIDWQSDIVKKYPPIIECHAIETLFKPYFKELSVTVDTNARPPYNLGHIKINVKLPYIDTKTETAAAELKQREAEVKIILDYCNQPFLKTMFNKNTIKL